MKVLFLCGFYPPDFENEIFQNSKRSYQSAAQKFQKGIIEGLYLNNVETTVITKPFISTFPFGYSSPVINYPVSQFNSDISIRKCFFINLPLLNNIISNMKKEVFNWCKKNSNCEKLNIIVYSLNADLMKVAIEAKRNFKNISLSIIILDLPEFMGANKYYRFLGLHNRDINYIYRTLPIFENYVLLTDAMIQRLNLPRKSCVIVEGIYYAEPIITESNNSISKENHIILYTGALSKKYGIETLLKAFSLIPNENYFLIICGDGDYKENIEQYCKLDKRIIFKGLVKSEYILGLQKEASLLINPRPPIGEYTEFSFPSKTIEYFASGTPVLMYKLPGVPTNYFDFCFTIDKLDEESLSKEIIKIFNFPLSFRTEMGQKASRFIKNNKNAKNQVHKIINLLETIE